MDSLINEKLIQELVNRQMEEEKFMPPQKPIGYPNDSKPLDPRLALVLGSLADSASTFGFLHKGRKEANPLLDSFNKNKWLPIPLGAGAAIGYNTLYKLMKNKGSSKVADISAGLIGGFHAGLAGNNMEGGKDSSFSRLGNDFYQFGKER